MNRLYLALLLSLFFISSCGEGSRGECFTDSYFATLDGNSERSAVFNLDMSDSASAYRLYIIARFSRGYEEETLPVAITIISPSGRTASEQISFPSDLNRVKAYTESEPDNINILLAEAPCYYDVQWEYRDEILPSERGIWSVELSIPERDKKVVGIGISITEIPLGQYERKR